MGLSVNMGGNLESVEMRKKLVITGGAGFIGSNLAVELISRDYVEKSELLYIRAESYHIL
jgi:hypothetical protein